MPAPARSVHIKILMVHYFILPKQINFCCFQLFAQVFQALVLIFSS